MTGIVFPNVANALLPIIQMDRLAESERLNRERMDRHDQWMQEDRKQAREQHQMEYLGKLDAQQRAQLKEQFEVTGKVAAGILSLPEADQPAAYEAAHAALTQQNYKINLPGKWSPGLKPQLQAFATQVPKYLEMLGGAAQPMGPGPGAVPGAGGPPATVAPDATKKGGELATYLTQNHGFSPVAAGGVVGGLYQESGFDPGYGFTRPGGDNGTAHGLAQWRLDRAEGLKKFAAAQGKPPTDERTQLDYLVSEMKGGDQGAQQAYGLLQQAKTPADAATAMMHFFRPAGYTPNNPQGGHGYNERVQYAQRFANPSDVGAVAGNPAQVPGPPSARMPDGPQFAQNGGGIPPQGGGEGGNVITPPAATRALPTTQGDTIGVDRLNPAMLPPGARFVSRHGKVSKPTPDSVEIQYPDGRLGELPLQKEKEPPAGYRQTPNGLEPIPGGPAAGMFGPGENSRALEHLVNQGILTKDQAANIAAGKVITNPVDQSQMFATPSFLVGTGGQGGGQPAASGGAPSTSNTPPGAVQLTQGKPEKPTEWQAKATGFAARMATANSLLDELAIQGTSSKGRFLESLGTVGNYAQSPEYQRFEQAKRNFMNSQLRDESGAVIGPSEFMSADKQYFPQPGQATNKELLAQMAENRRQVVEAMMLKAGVLKPGQRYETPTTSPGSDSGGDAPKVRKFNPQTGALE